jgi:hypothetical protein
MLTQTSPTCPCSRRAPRIPARVSVALLVEPGETHDASIVDFSQQGARVRVGTPLSPGQGIQIIPIKGAPYSVLARVAWVRPSWFGRITEAGLEFLDPL